MPTRWEPSWPKRGVRFGEDDPHAVELTVAPTLIAGVPLAGRIVTGDALDCQRALSAQIIAAGGDYLFTVKANQPALARDLQRFFTDLPPDEQSIMVSQRGRHGDRDEVRILRASGALAEYLAWPGARVVIHLARTAIRRGQSTTESRLFITSLPPAATGGSKIGSTACAM